MKFRDEVTRCKNLAREAIKLLREESTHLTVAKKVAEDCWPLLCDREIFDGHLDPVSCQALVDWIDFVSTELTRGIHPSSSGEGGGNGRICENLVEGLVTSLRSAVGGLPENEPCLFPQAPLAPIREPAFVIEDASNETPPQLPKLLLVCAMYDWEPSATHNTWSSRAIGKEIRLLLQDVVRKIRGEWNGCLEEDIMVESIEPILDILRPAILWRRPQSDDPVRSSHILSEIDRLVAAHQLLWCTSHCGGQNFSERVANCLFPFVFSTIDDPSPSVQAVGLTSLGVLNDKVQTSWLTPWREVLLNTLSGAIRNAVSSGNESVWRRLFPLASQLVVRIEGGHPRKAGYDVLISLMIEGVGMRVLQKPHRVILMESLQPLVEALGLVTVRHFADLIPLLCGYCCSDESDTMAAGLTTLALVVKHTWPRIPPHAGVLWKVVVAAYRIARKQQDPLVENVEEGIRSLCRMLLLTSWEASMLYLESCDWMRSEGDVLRGICSCLINELGGGAARKVEVF
ncbi:hypothetical protein BSKO_06414 [Bryopsis sp. KO-2023]|nr:hypothetical protein BSKO_06414 [Bryopsis sp. KO-2023]